MSCQYFMSKMNQILRHIVCTRESSSESSPNNSFRYQLLILPRLSELENNGKVDYENISTDSNKTRSCSLEIRTYRAMFLTVTMPAAPTAYKLRSVLQSPF